MKKKKEDMHFEYKHTKKLSADNIEQILTTLQVVVSTLHTLVGSLSNQSWVHVNYEEDK